MLRAGTFYCIKNIYQVTGQDRSDLECVNSSRRMADHLVPAVDEIGLTLNSKQWQDLHCLSATSASAHAVSQEPMQPHEQPVQKHLAVRSDASHLI